MTATTGGAPIIARRPSARGPITADEATAELEAAQAGYVEAEAVYFQALHARGRAAHVAHLRTRMTWAQIGAALGGIKGHTAQELVDRYLTAVAEGRTLGVSRHR